MKKVLAAMLALIMTGCAFISDEQSARTELLFYGIFDNSDAYRDIIANYEKQNPSIKVSYRKLTQDEYFARLDNELSDDKLDVLMLPYHLVRSKTQSLASAKNFTRTELLNDFVVSGAKSCIWENLVWCVPANTDNLALFYNPNLVANPAKTWEDAMRIANQVFSKSKGLISGLAIGAFENITRAEEILALLLMQKGTKFFDAGFNNIIDQPVGTDRQGYPRYPAEEVKNFWNSNKTWNEARDYYASEFAKGRLAMAIGYSWLIERIKQDNPKANIAVAPIPYFVEYPKNNFSLSAGWVYAVNRNSNKQDEAWKFIRFLTEMENAARYAESTRTIPARKDLLLGMENSNLPESVFVRQAISAEALPEHNDWEGVFKWLRGWIDES
ncbi:MAG: ABC transporter substrate-binding protein [Patescibacteria group bacterium]|nr:ABC transporter substrate-binding protein [Patescibacteria group bacterium]